uniref:Uncharacterized protein n=1 Tax=Acrobeloides nanus TaxID=290746 RepID=A0A914DJ33_9BILA
METKFYEICLVMAMSFGVAATLCYRVFQPPTTLLSVSVVHFKNFVRDHSSMNKFMQKLLLEHVNIDCLLAHPPKNRDNHRYEDVVINYYDNY